MKASFAALLLIAAALNSGARAAPISLEELQSSPATAHQDYSFLMPYAQQNVFQAQLALEKQTMVQSAIKEEPIVIEPAKPWWDTKVFESISQSMMMVAQLTYAMRRFRKTQG